MRFEGATGVRVLNRAGGAFAVGALGLAAASCSRGCARGTLPLDAGGVGDASLVSAPSATSPGAPRPGMVWVPSGMLRAGTPLEDVPRVAEAELPGTELALGGFYIDVLPYPNEAGAIPTSNVTREDAVRLCSAKGKRLCTELEWERACKGPQNTRYEYGDDYAGQPCGTGVPADQGAKRPSGGLLSCKSGFGARDMHGGVLEWTDSPWGRGSEGHDLGALRGGNGVMGEIVARCANASASDPGAKSPTVGLRCCAGPRNDARVELEVKRGQIFEKSASGDVLSLPVVALGNITCGGPEDAPCGLPRAWTWRPVPNVQLALRGGCIGQTTSSRCGLAVATTLATTAGSATKVLAQVDTGREVPEVVLVQGNEHRIRVRGADAKGNFFRELIYAYGRVDVKVVGP